ncbi:MAG: ankyrin repeat domain-containing protein [Kiloniellales bacterium]|nr:ankyrin repeat domain-containing protein [Kiloniellales bacterium]
MTITRMSVRKAIAVGHGCSEAAVKDYLVSAALHMTDEVRYYIEVLGLHPDATFGGKPTALCYAVLKPHFTLMTYVIEKGADINHFDRMGMTPLHYAALGGCEHCLAFLVSRGAGLNTANRRGDTPLALAACKPHLADGCEFLRRCGAALDAAEPARSSFH